MNHCVPLDVATGVPKHAAMNSNSPILPFEPSARVPLLASGEIHVWFLTHGEPNARATTVAARAQLIRLLSAYAGLDSAPTIERGTHGKPFAPDLPDLHFNLSHAGHHVLLAFSRDMALGVDLEVVQRRVSLDGIARRFFAPAETLALSGLPEPLQHSAFLQLWTHKEAVLKALGIGIGFGLERVEFTLDATGTIASLHAVAEEAGNPEQWCVRRLDPAPGLFGALAWRGSPRTLRTFTLLP